MRKAIALGTGVAVIQWFNIAAAKSRSEYRSLTLTLMQPSCFEEEAGGYAPAESVELKLYVKDVEALITALQLAIDDQPVKETDND